MTASNEPNSRQRQQFMRAVESDGLEAALGGIVAGAFNLVVLDLERAIFSVANDRVGSIPIYFSVAPEGCLVTTAPGLAGVVGFVSREPDLTAIAEVRHSWSHRSLHFLKGLRRLAPASILRWDDRSGVFAVSSTGLSPGVSVPPSASPCWMRSPGGPARPAAGLPVSRGGTHCS